MESTSKYVSLALSRTWLFCVERRRIAMKIFKKIVVPVLAVFLLSAGLCYGQSTAKEIAAKGVEYAAQRKFKEAKEEFEKALKVDPFYVFLSRCLELIEDVADKKIDNKTAVHFFNGADYYFKGQFDKSIDELNRAIELNQRFAFAYCVRGIARVKKGDHDRAIADLNKAIEISPSLAYAYFLRGITLGSE
jgi:tetratricopeptide (TPR) repeat protein